jgi:OmpA-OmpF porin, OOP family
MKSLMVLVLTAILLCLSIPVFAADTEGCHDAPQFNRLLNYEIRSCDSSDFNSYNFPTGVPSDSFQRVEGKYWMVDYYVKDGGKANSPLATVRNFQKAIEKAGGKIVFLDDFDMMRVTGKITKGGAETWVYVSPRDLGSGYTIYVVQQGEMTQEITSNVMMDSLNANGHIALAINFDTGKATIKNESEPIIAQMVELMKGNPDLKVEIQGHTDNVGKADANKKLSQDRADAVKKALVDAGIATARMTAAGYGDTKPVADNATDAGKARNRRVELVKK